MILQETEAETDDRNAKLTPDLKRNEQLLKDLFHNCYDVVFHPLQVEGLAPMLLIYVNGLCDTDHLEGVFLKLLFTEGMPRQLQESGQTYAERAIPFGQIMKASKLSDIATSMLNGNAVFLGEGDDQALIVKISGWEKRTVEEPASESFIRGPREGFIESVSTNISMIRRRLRTPRLKMELATVGDLSQTPVVISYIEGIATEAVIEEIRSRIGRIQIDGILDSGYIEQFIEDSPFSPFPQVLNTERPDVAAGQLLEGRVAILVDGSPFALIVPVTFWSSMQSGEDYYERVVIGTAIRSLRVIFLFIALFLPSFYVAITTFHQEMIPTSLLLSIAAAREKSPFPSLIEALIMEITFEALREAGIRLPRQVGSAVSIVGVLVIGESAVRAGIVSAPLVIVVSLTGIASFTMPRYSLGIAIRLLRFPIIILAGTLGLYGIALGLVAVLFHVNSLHSFGVPFFAPVTPLVPENLKDVFVRAPLWSRIFRPRYIAYKNSQRLALGQKPGHKQKDE